MAGGIQFTTADGTYFVRDEVLTACKLEGEELAGAEKDLAADHEAVVTDSMHIDRDEMPPLEFSTVGGGEDEMASREIAPTVMCCW